MLKFYYNPISVNARRVWVALLEKQIPFELLLLNLNGDQFQEEFTAINPLQRVPVIVDDGLRVVESLAILDYLEAKYPTPALIPSEPGAIATVRMVEMITVNELQPATLILTRPLVELDTDAKKLELAQETVTKILRFYETLLGEQTYFVGKDFTLAEVVAGTLIPSLPLFGFSLDDYPRLLAWAERLEERESWQKTTPDFASIAAAIPNIKAILERRF
ncbi:glutathione S-transferase family protein [Anabaena subtropica]|uniref:Glutathione S-transferase family protein n=1 Tax=Anabaena subtropica FACHB-260 TaxID=2692884 RepID=A0ABR8CPK8_9NOST|nr:glutathione S-transferase family protein [Anabaena subtropica]MBD2344979.1 glutathione S-transferase family protein [Anabaena subtropica FACHB-260]